jgi:selenium metabolism protein YedF
MKTVMILNGETLGRGSDELGATLMGSFLRKLWASEHKPDTILFYNASVKLLAKGSPVLDALAGLAKAGVDLAACGTCVNYYKLEGQIAAGRVSNMQEIVALQMGADKVVTP